MSTEPTFQAEVPVPLFKDIYGYATYIQMPGYSVFPDGSQLLMVKPDEELGKANEIRIVTSWLDELERLVPTK